jgi:Zn-dependent peptidase ImmA (M78 family)
VNAMSFGNWEMQAGDPSRFAFRLAFLPNPDGDEDRATPDERESWGAFSVWVNGEDLCAHVELGEVLDSAHWYLLPLLEWLAGNWDPLLHEERLPLANAGISAAESLARTRMPPLSLKEVDDFEWLDAWSAWWDRHCVRSAREGGLFPDLYLRRYRDRLEISTGAEPLPGISDEFRFLTPHRTYQVDPVPAAEALFSVLSAAVGELKRRLPQSARIQRLSTRVADLMSPARTTSRMAWLAGLGEDVGKYDRVAQAVDGALATAGEQARRQIIGTRRATPLVVDGSAYARLLYGAISPDTSLEDVVLLTRRIVENYVPDAGPWLSRLNLRLDVGEVGQLPLGEQGSRLGERACEALGGDGGWVDGHSIVRDLGIRVSKIELSDDAVRAVSVFGPTQVPHAFCNRRTRWGESFEVERFTLGHELCHLLLDREYGDELAIASGPWAPLGIEQRANAFAAAFLMPTWLLKDALAAAEAPADQPGTIEAVSASLRVSASSLIDRLYNLGEITFDDRVRLRGFSGPAREQPGAGSGRDERGKEA